MVITNPVPTRELMKNINQFFGENPTYYAKYKLAGHNGLDIALKTGEQVLSVADGWVLEATDKTGGYGVRVVTFHEFGDEALLVVYGHLQSTLFPDWVWNGFTYRAEVKKGQQIGLGDSTGDSSGPHLHLTCEPYHKVNGQWVKKYPNNGFFGAIDPLLLIQLKGMAKLIKDNRKNPPEILVVETCDTPERLKWKCEQVGIPLPLKVDGTPDWVHIPYDGEING